MAKLYFRYGAMGSSKTANALMVRYNYLERGMEALLLKPKIDIRDGEKVIHSRLGVEAPCEYVEDFICMAEKTWKRPTDAAGYAAVIIDEAQFMTRDQVDFMAHVVDEIGLPVICYGLRTDFRGEMFPGSSRLFELADVIEQIPTVCWCGKKAHFNARISAGKVVRTGQQVLLGGNESYTALCRRHYMLGQLGEGEPEAKNLDKEEITDERTGTLCIMDGQTPGR